MKINLKQLSLFIVTLFLFAFCLSCDCFADDKYYPYTIDAYDIDMKVNENNTFDITESIHVNFISPRHGIKREIPLKNKVTRLDGTTSSNRAEISNIEVNEPYKLAKRNGFTTIQIGDKDIETTGTKEYVIKYTYNIGKDPLKDKDELYFNLIGTSWDTTINNITFTIDMPKTFDKTKLGFSVGSVGSTNSKYVTYDIRGTKIIGRLNAKLGPNQALTIRCELDEDYFSGETLKQNHLKYLLIIIPILFTIISIILWYKYGRDEEVIETIEFYPPDGLNSLEIGYNYKGCVKSKDVTSLLIYLANKGYIKISVIESENPFSSLASNQSIKVNGVKISELSGKYSTFKFIKLKEYDGSNKYEEEFFNGLFSNGKTEVTYEDLYNKFYKTTNSIIKSIDKENKNKIFEKSSLNKIFIIKIFKIITLLLITVPPVYEYSFPGAIIFALLIPYIIFSGIFDMSYKIITKQSEQDISIIGFIVMVIIFMVVIFAPLNIFVIPAITSEAIYLISYILGYLLMIIMNVIINIIPKRSKYGNEMLGRIRGFKNFLETAEKDRLEALVNENPAYFYDILPFTYALDVSDVWIKRFESINLTQPEWYDSPSSFSITSFDSFISSTIDSANSAMSSSPSSSSSSGGGSSGGGSGGGGGSSW